MMSKTLDELIEIYVSRLKDETTFAIMQCDEGTAASQFRKIKENINVLEQLLRNDGAGEGKKRSD